MRGDLNDSVEKFVSIPAADILNDLAAPSLSFFDFLVEVWPERLNATKLSSSSKIS